MKKYLTPKIIIGLFALVAIAFALLPLAWQGPGDQKGPRPLVGTIINIEGDTITLQIKAEKEIDIFITPTTKTFSTSTISVGQKVQVFVDKNKDDRPTIEYIRPLN